MWHAYWQTVRTSGIDWFILALGSALVAAQLLGLALRYRGRSVLFVQGLDRYRTVCLLLTELLPLLGLLGTVLSLMNTFRGFETAAGDAPNMSAMVQAFAPALSTTISGLLMILPNLVLNALLWLVAPNAADDEAA